MSAPTLTAAIAFFVGYVAGVCGERLGQRLRRRAGPSPCAARSFIGETWEIAEGRRTRPPRGAGDS